MSCSNITQGIQKGCNNNLGGIRNIYIADRPITGYVIQNDLIKSFSPSTIEWLTVEADQGTGNFTETYEINQMGGIIAFKQSVTFQINDLSAYNQQRIAELAESTNLGCVVEMNNGTYFTVGLDRGAYLETGSTSSGTAYGDLSGSTITITGMELISSLGVKPTTIQNIQNALYYAYGSGAGTTYFAMVALQGQEYTSPESAAIAVAGFEQKCNVSNITMQGLIIYWDKDADVTNVGTPIPVYTSSGNQFSWGQVGNPASGRNYQWSLYIDVSLYNPVFCPLRTTNVWQLELGEINSKTYIIGSTLLYSI